MTNFKQETLELIGDHEVDEYYLEYIGCWSVSENPLYNGRDEIDWDFIFVGNLSYDKGYGSQYWKGWITFKDTADWLERESYDGMEWWVWRSKPSLEKEERKLNDKNI